MKKITIKIPGEHTYGFEVGFTIKYDDAQQPESVIAVFARMDSISQSGVLGVKEQKMDTVKLNHDGYDLSLLGSVIKRVFEDSMRNSKFLKQLEYRRDDCHST